MGLPRSVKPKDGMKPSSWMNGEWVKGSLGKRYFHEGVGSAVRRVYKTQTAKRRRRQEREEIEQELMGTAEPVQREDMSYPYSDPYYPAYGATAHRLPDGTIQHTSPAPPDDEIEVF